MIIMAEEKKSEKEKLATKEKIAKAVKKEKAVTKETNKPEKKSSEVKEVKLADAAKIADPFSILKFVLMTEKAVQVIEKQNKLVFVVDRSADKSNIKAAVEAAFSAPISKVQTMIDQEGRKKAFVKFRNAGAAGDIAIKLGII